MAQPFAAHESLPLAGTRLGAAFAQALTFLCVTIGWVFFRADSVPVAVSMLRAMVGMAAAPPDPGVAAVNAADGALFAIASLLAIAFFAPNTQQIMQGYRPGLVDSRQRDAAPYTGRLVWRPTRGWAVAIAVVTVWGVLGINRLSEFLYFQF